MAALTAASASARLRAAVDAVLGAHASLVFSEDRKVGALLAVATLTEPRFFALALCSVLVARGAMSWLGIRADMGSSPYGYNALLVGLGVANAYEFDVASAVFAGMLGAVSVLVTGALSSWLGRIAGLPVLSLPFLLTSSLAAGTAAYAPLSATIPASDRWASALPSWLALVFESLGSIFFLPRVLAGAIVLCGLVWHSRIAALLAAMGLASTLTMGAVAHVPLSQRMLLGTAFNAALTSIAVGGVWFVPSRSSFLLAFGSALLAVFFNLGLAGPLARLGLPILVLPFNAAVLTVLFAMRQRKSDGNPYASDLLSPTPEASLLAFHTKRTPGDPLGIRVHLPFRGAWTCTQAVDGAFTHKGTWRNAFDFEVHAGAEGTLCLRDGASVEDYHCFRLPVLAAADGTVVAIENDLIDNAVGDSNDKQPWGNRVTLQHGPYLYSTVAHLARGSVAVWLGQLVRRGDLLGHCGSSGRSPRPHLHFQLQAGPTMLAPTIPCRFTHAVIRSPGDEHIAYDVEPREGVALRNVEPDATMGSYFDLPLGQTFALLGAHREQIGCEVDPWGRRILRSRELGASLVYERTEHDFSAYEVAGAAASALYLVRLALPRIPFETAASLQWKDRVPRRWVMGRLHRAIWDVVAPFTTRHDIEIVYQRSWERDRLVVCGASSEHRHGKPLVRTRAVLVRGGVTTVEVIVGGRVRRAAAPPPDDERISRSDSAFHRHAVLPSVGDES